MPRERPKKWKKEKKKKKVLEKVKSETSLSKEEILNFSCKHNYTWLFLEALKCGKVSHWFLSHNPPPWERSLNKYSWTLRNFLRYLGDTNLTSTVTLLYPTNSIITSNHYISFSNINFKSSFSRVRFNFIGFESSKNTSSFGYNFNEGKSIFTGLLNPYCENLSSFTYTHIHSYARMHINDM